MGLIAGWLAGQFVKGGGFGLVGDIVVGIVGAFVAINQFDFSAATGMAEVVNGLLAQLAPH